MKILYITQFFPPEIGAAANRAYETAALLVKNGFDVTVLTAYPNYLMDEIPAGYKKRKRPVHETLGGIHVTRTYLSFNRNPQSIARRIITFLTFMVSSLLQGLKMKGCDVIFVTSPPLSLGLTSYILSRVKGIPYIFEIRDLYPESAVQLNVIRNRLLIGLTRRFAHFVYRNACHLVAVTDGMRKHLEAEGFRRAVRVLTTGVDLSAFQPVPPDEEIVGRFHFRGKCNVLFLGIFGRMHALSTVLDAAERLKDVPDIQFTFIGHGVQTDFLIDEVRKRNLTNVQIHPPQPRETVPRIINASDICLDSRVKIGLSEGTIPVKVVEYMACGKPVIVGISGETVDIIRESGAGLVVEPENSEAMAEAIRSLYADETLRNRMGRKGRMFTERYFDRSHIVGRLNAVFLDVLKTCSDETS